MLQPSIECRSIPPYMAGDVQVELVHRALALMPSHAWNNPTDRGKHLSQTVSPRCRASAFVLACSRTSILQQASNVKSSGFPGGYTAPASAFLSSHRMKAGGSPQRRFADFPYGVILFDEVLPKEAYASIELTLESDGIQVIARAGDRIIHGKWVPKE